VELVNQRYQAPIENMAVTTTAHHTVASLDALTQARARMAQNSPPLLVLESLLITISGRLGGRVAS
jgi:hypothetical protein